MNHKSNTNLNKSNDFREILFKNILYEFSSIRVNNSQPNTQGTG